MGFWRDVTAAGRQAGDRRVNQINGWQAQYLETRAAKQVALPGTKRGRGPGVLGAFGYRLKSIDNPDDRPGLGVWLLAFLLTIPFLPVIFVRFARRSSTQGSGLVAAWGLWLAAILFAVLSNAWWEGLGLVSILLWLGASLVLLVYLWRTYVERIRVGPPPMSKRLGDMAAAVRAGDDLTCLAVTPFINDPSVAGTSVARTREASRGRVMMGSAFGALISTHAQRSALLLGPARSGKTTTVLAPTVAGWDGPVIVTTTKHDDKAIQEAIAQSQWEGRPVFTFTPTKTDLPDAFYWSPLGMAVTWEGARLIAREMTGAVTTARERSGENGYFLDRAEALLGALLHVGAVSCKDMETVVRWVTQPPAPPTSGGRVPPPEWAMEIVNYQDDIDPLAQLVLDGFKQSGGGENRGLWAIWATCARTVNGFLDARVLASTKPPKDWKWSIEQVLRENGVLLISAPSREQQLCVVSVTGLIGEAITTRYRLGSECRPLLLALDEVANIAPIRDLHSVLSEGGSQGVTTLAVLQDLSQARHRFEIGDGILSLANSVVVFPGIRDAATLQNLERLAGSEYHRLETRTTMTGSSSSKGETSRSNQETVGETIQSLNVLTAAEISRGFRLHAALFTSDMAPFFMRMHPLDVLPETEVAMVEDQPVRAIELITGERTEASAALSALS